ncbi:MAG: hypothetical protein JNM41_09520 [Flavipsychrobacter sp.]|nr:hypothetical protein [Flavipsychrobacter sp.]
MKHTILLLLAGALLAGACSKSPSGKASATRCVCTYKKNPLKDTTVKYAVDPGLAISVDSQCNYHLAVLKSYAGNNGASCYLQ